MTERGCPPRRAARTGNGPRDAVAGTIALIVVLLAAGCGDRTAVTEGGSAAVRRTIPTVDGQPIQLCTDTAGDGGAADLLSVASTYAQQQVFLAFSFAAALPSGTATLALESASPPRKIRIGLRDALPAAVVMETADSTATAAHPDEVVHVAGAAVHVVLPAVTVPADARGWQVVVTVGTAADQCGR